MTVTYKILDITETLEHRKDGGRIVISTGLPDRDKDRVFPQGAKLANYLKNPVVLWGHNYYSADALIGRAKTIEITETGIVADFELRPAATEVDPQNIVLLLWDQKFVHASSIGFKPEPGQMLQNEFGGIDFVSWELLEFSLVSVPANADALRLAAEAYPKAFKSYQAEIVKRGRVLSAANESKIKQAHDNLGAVLEQIAGDANDDGKSADPVADLAKQVSDLHSKLDQLLALKSPVHSPEPEPIDYTDSLTRLRALRAALNPARS